MINHEYGIDLGSVDDCHLDRLRRWRNDPRIWQWCRQNDLISEIDQKNWLIKIKSDPTIKMYTIWTKNVTDLVGCCGFTSIDHINQRAEFSLYIGPEYHRMHFAEMALRTLFHHGFESLNLYTIWGETFSNNPALKLFNKMGMIKEGIRRNFYFKNGKFIDAHLMGINREDWKCQTYLPSMQEVSSSQAV